VFDVLKLIHSFDLITLQIFLSLVL
jgi:hypothetical protein